MTPFEELVQRYGPASVTFDHDRTQFRVRVPGKAWKLERGEVEMHGFGPDIETAAASLLTECHQNPPTNASASPGIRWADHPHPRRASSARAAR